MLKIILVLVFITSVNVQIVNSQESKTNVVKSAQTQCSPFIEELEICLKSSNIYVKSGEVVILRYSIKNSTEKQVKINGGRRGGSGFLEIIVFDENGNKIPTIVETQIEKMKKEKLSQGDQGKLFTFSYGSGPYSSIFEPNEESHWNWNLSNLYDFKNKGKFYIELYKKPYPPDEKQNSIKLLEKISLDIQ